MRRPMMSGHCATPSTSHPEESHARCRGGQRANPEKEFQPCPCPCHFVRNAEGEVDEFDCDPKQGGCGGLLVETAWPNEDPDDVDEDGHPYAVFTHVDPRTGLATGEECG